MILPSVYAVVPFEATAPNTIVRDSDDPDPISPCSYTQIGMTEVAGVELPEQTKKTRDPDEVRDPASSEGGLRPAPDLAAYLKLACTCVSLEIVTLQVGDVPEQAPPQFTKFRPGAGVAVRVTVVPCANLAEQLLPHVIWVENAPAVSLVTVPEPPLPIDSVNTGVKVAVTFSASLTVSVQFRSAPLQAPLQPLKMPLPGLAVNVTVLPAATFAVHEPPQLILPFAPVTVPVPILFMVTEGTPTLAAAICEPM